MASIDLDGGENPAPVNVTPLVDVIFCLCVFFMISFRFQQVEGTLDTWLPKSRGTSEDASGAAWLDEIRVLLLQDDATGAVQIRFGQRDVASDELRSLLAQARADHARANDPDPAMTIDAAAGVPWQEVVTVVDLSRALGFARIEFALGAPPAR